MLKHFLLPFVAYEANPGWHVPISSLSLASTVARFVDPKAQKKRKAANPAATTGGFDEKTGAPVVIDWQYAMAELSKKNGVDVDEEIRKARDTELLGRSSFWF